MVVMCMVVEFVVLGALLVMAVLFVSVALVMMMMMMVEWVLMLVEVVIATFMAVTEVLLHFTSNNVLSCW